MGLIYKITNNFNQKSYIGLTTRPSQVRYKEHFCRLDADYDTQKDGYLHRAMKLYGPQNFSFEVIEDNIEDYNILQEREIYWIKYYNTYKEGYNMTKGGNQPTHQKYDLNQIKDLWNQGHTRTEISEIIHCNPGYMSVLLHRIGLTMQEISSRGNAYRSMPIEQYSLSGQYINMYPSIRRAAIIFFNDANKAVNIRSACMGKIAQAYNYIWKFTDDETPISTLVTRVNQRRHQWGRAVDQFDLNFHYITTYPNATQAAKTLGLKSSTSITNVLKGRAKTAGGYIWKYHED